MGAYLLSGEVLRQIGLGLGWLAPLSFTAAVALGYVLQKLWVFEDRRRLAASLPRYVGMVAWGYILNSLVLAYLYRSMSLFWAQLLAAALVTVSNACCAAIWVFSGRDGR